MMERKRWSIAVGSLLAACLIAGCADGARPFGPDVEARMTTGTTTDETGGLDGGVIGAEQEGGTSTTATDTTSREGPGGTIGSGH
jgi:hypothetical protein